MPTDRKIVLTIVWFAGLTTLALTLIYGSLLRDVIHQAGVRGPVDSATLGAIGAMGPLVGAAVTGMFALLTSTRSSQPDIPQQVEVVEPLPDDEGAE